MLRVVLDPGVLVSGLLVAQGHPGRIVDHWREGEFELVVSELLLTELEEVLLRPHLASRVDYVDYPVARRHAAGMTPRTFTDLIERNA